MAAGVAPTSNFSNLVDTAVLPDYANYRWELTKRKRLLMDSLTQNGSIAAADGGGGKYMDWLATVGEFDLADHQDMGARTFNRVNTDITYTAPYAFLETTDAISENDWGFLQTKQARNSAAKERTAKIVEDQGKKLNRRLLQQNNTSNSVFGIAASTSTQLLGGLPTLFGYGATAQKYDPTSTTAVTTTITAADKECLPTTTYFGQITHPLNTLTGVPDSMRVQGATSPVIANWSSTAWAYTTTAVFTTWTGNCLYVFDYLISRVQKDASMEYLPDIGIMTQDLYLKAKGAIRGTGQLHVVLSDEPTSPDVGMFKRPFFKYMGVTMSWDIDQATNLFYLLNTKKAKFRYLDAQLAGFDNNAGPYDPGKKKFMTMKAFPDLNVGAFKFVSKMGAQIIWQPDAQGAAYTFA